MRVFHLLCGLALICGCSPYKDLSGLGFVCVVEQGGSWSPWGSSYTTSGTPEPVLSAGPSDIIVVLSDCHSSSVQDETAACSVSGEGTIIEVASEGGWIPPRGGQNDDCNVLSATCAGPELTDGAWTLTYGNETLDFDVPATGTPCTEGQYGEG